MINLRYHIVSITAVFLALGIGLVFGGVSFIDRATVNQLDRNLDAIEEQNRDLEAENTRLSQQVAAADAEEQELREQGLTQLVAGHLTDVPVVVVAVRGVDEDVVRVTSETLSAAGAELGGVLWFTDRLVLDDESEVADLADVLQLGIDDPGRLRASLARRLATVLVAAAEPAVEPVPPTVEGAPVDTTSTTLPVDVVATPEPPLLSALRSAEFIELDAPQVPPAGFAVVPEAGLRIVVVSGPGAVLPDTDVVAPFLERLTQDVVPGAVGPVVVSAQRGPDDGAVATDDFDPDAERVLFVGPLRTAESLRERLSTVDDLERFTGLVATVLALEHGAAGQFGHYGVGEGAQSLLPPQPSPEGG